ncbi:hypothetical protein KFU94_14215 [Chloroflexi bacterium TSY]|nr:hypothetical protein [Chloroflexi bacterium TSY]
MFAKVIDEQGDAIQGVQIYHKGALVVDEGETSTTSDKAGLMRLPNVTTGDVIVTLAEVFEQSTLRRVHDDWAYRVYTSNLHKDTNGAPHPDTVGDPGQQLVILGSRDPLILFNIVVSIEWDADKQYLVMIEDAFRKASDYLYDVTDGQMAFGQVNMYDNAQYWSDADFQISTKNTVRPYAFVGGITSDDTAHSIRVGRFWSGNSGNEGNWNEPNGYRTLIHEFGHYALYLYDEYFVRTVNASGHFTGQRVAACTSLEVGPTSGRNQSDPHPEQPENASIMYYQYKASELADSNRWSTSCRNTEQHRLNGKSDWETVLEHYGGHGWTLNTPSSRGSVMGGPSEFPRHLLPFPKISIHNGGIIKDNSASHEITVVDPQRQPVSNVLVALFKERGEQSIAIDQGLTDTAGHITVYGANKDDRIQAASFDGVLAGRATVGEEVAIELLLKPIGALAAASDVGKSTPYLSITPSSDGTGFIIQVNGVPQSSQSLHASLSPAEGGGSPQSTALAYSPSGAIYSGAVSLDGVGLGTGKLQVTGGNLTIPLNSDYNLQRVIYSKSNSLYSEDQ